MFTNALQRRLTAAGSTVLSLAAHPGLAMTGSRPEAMSPMLRAVLWASQPLIQSADDGARPILFAASEELPGGSYVGPSGIGQFRGAPKLVDSSKAARNDGDANRLWKLSEDLTGVKFGLAR